MKIAVLIGVFLLASLAGCSKSQDFSSTNEPPKVAPPPNSQKKFQGTVQMKTTQPVSQPQTVP